MRVNFDLIKKSKYYDPSINFTDNVWEYFFDVENEDYVSISRTVWGDFGNFYGYDFDFNNLESRVVSEEIISKYLLVKPGTSKKIENFYNDNFKK